MDVYQVHVIFTQIDYLLVAVFQSFVERVGVAGTVAKSFQEQANMVAACL